MTTPPTRRAALAAALLLALPAAAAADGKKVRIAMVGDSTMASYPRPPADRPDLTGWGQVFGEFFTADVEVLNHAASGRSTKSFVAEKRWAQVLALKPDYVFVQFGHNDQKDKSLAPDGGFADFLRRYVDEARAAGINPVLVTPVARRTFAGGKASTTLAPFADATKAVAKEKGVPVVDLHRAALELFDRLGDAGSADLTASPTDRTHFSRKGGRAVAGLVAEAIPDAAPGLTPYLKR